MGMKLPPELAAKVLELSGDQKPKATEEVPEVLERPANGWTRRPKKEPVRKRPKYNAKKTVIDGITFDSKKEADRYSVLKIFMLIGRITGLELQASYKLVVNGVLVCRYVADFVYNDANGNQVVEDCKGFKTREYKLKRKLMRAVHGIEIKEV